MLLVYSCLVCLVLVVVSSVSCKCTFKICSLYLIVVCFISYSLCSAQCFFFFVLFCFVFCFVMGAYKTPLVIIISITAALYYRHSFFRLRLAQVSVWSILSLSIQPRSLLATAGTLQMTPECSQSQ